MARKVPQSAKPKDLDPSLPIYQLKITVRDIQPSIWRRVQTTDCSLSELHDIIQVSMGWDDAHVHVFEVEGRQYTDYGSWDVDPYEYRDSRRVRLSKLVEKRCFRFVYEYDFGDSWRHTVEIENTVQPEPGIRYPRCTAGKRACPPEDCGGPWGYENLVEAIHDPAHKDHGEKVEWYGGLDPEQFDLDQVNRDLLSSRRWLGRRRGKQLPEASFGEGQLVRVKPGVVHSRYPDIPLGGWEATVTRVAWLIPMGYQVRWTERTLAAAHAIYFKRCSQDDLESAEHFLEEGELEAVSSEQPLEMEQPQDLAARPLSMDDPDDRVRAVFGLTSDDPLPQVSDPTQQQFLGFLRSHLSFPFEADYWPASSLGPKEQGKLTVEGFADPPLDPVEGIQCRARRGTAEYRVPLSTVAVAKEDSNFDYVEDYTYWLWECEARDGEAGAYFEEDIEDEEFDLDGDEEEEFDEKDEDDFEEDDFEEDELDVEEPTAEARFPIGTVALYGPDDKTTTKIVAGVILHPGAEPILKRWVATDVLTSLKVSRGMDKFFKKYGVERIGMSEGNMGCPHEEGEDFPVGGDCPFCPYWKGKQGSGAAE
ncbi:MAG: hypothetical protein HUU20_02025 [Pirellulales bacterium]|nr:hypothetical protein [Pirellulales bacterium]